MGIEVPKSRLAVPHVVERSKDAPRGKFSGRPRAGQWLLVDGRRVAIHAPPNAESEMARKIPPGHFLVHFVDQFGYTIGWEIVELSRLEPLLDRNMVPKPRLETMDPHWTPRP